MMREWEDKVNEMIDGIPDDEFEESLEVMIDLAQTALDARREERRNAADVPEEGEAD